MGTCYNPLHLGWKWVLTSGSGDTPPPRPRQSLLCSPTLFSHSSPLCPGFTSFASLLPSISTKGKSETKTCCWHLDLWSQTPTVQPTSCVDQFYTFCGLRDTPNTPEPSFISACDKTVPPDVWQAVKGVGRVSYCLPWLPGALGSNKELGLKVSLRNKRRDEGQSSYACTTLQGIFCLSLPIYSSFFSSQEANQYGPLQ